jgi:hypothetical protein
MPVGDFVEKLAEKVNSKRNITNYILETLSKFPDLLDRWIRYRFQTILLVCFLLWTPLLVAETLQVQHSCHPMIYWARLLPAECQPKRPPTRPRSSRKAETQREQSQEQQQIAQRDPIPSLNPSSTSQPKTSKTSQSGSSSGQVEGKTQENNGGDDDEQNLVGKIFRSAKEHPGTTGAAIGIGVAGAVVVVASAPLTVAAGVGAAVWFAIKTALQ